MNNRRMAIKAMVFSVIGIVAALAALLVLAVGCGTPSVTGTVVAKEYDAAEWKHKQECVSKRDGKCKRYVTKRTLVEGEEWEVTVRDDDGYDHEFDVSESLYNQLKKGDRVVTGDKWQVNP